MNVLYLIHQDAFNGTPKNWPVSPNFGTCKGHSVVAVPKKLPAMGLEASEAISWRTESELD